MVQEAHAILKNVDDQVYIKVPTTEEGLKAIRALKAENVNITATAIYTKIQGFMAIAAGADFIAPYYNRMENLDIDSSSTVKVFREMIDKNESSTKILAASFKNTAQVISALLAGAHAVTVQPNLLHEAFGAAAIKKAVDDFHADWIKTQGEVSIADLRQSGREDSDKQKSLRTGKGKIKKPRRIFLRGFLLMKDANKFVCIIHIVR